MEPTVVRAWRSALVLAPQPTRTAPPLPRVTGLVITLACRRLRVAHAGLPQVAVADRLTIIRLPRPAHADDVAREVQACNAMTHGTVVEEPIRYAELSAEARTPARFRAAVLLPLLGLRASPTAYPGGAAGALADWRMVLRLTRLHALVCGRAELASSALHHVFAQWLHAQVDVPYLVLDFHSGRYSVLVTNAPPPPPGGNDEPTPARDS